MKNIINKIKEFFKGDLNKKSWILLTFLIVGSICTAILGIIHIINGNVQLGFASIFEAILVASLGFQTKNWEWDRNRNVEYYCIMAAQKKKIEYLCKKLGVNPEDVEVPEDEND